MCDWRVWTLALSESRTVLMLWYRCFQPENTAVPSDSCSQRNPPTYTTRKYCMLTCKCVHVAMNTHTLALCHDPPPSKSTPLREVWHFLSLLSLWASAEWDQWQFAASLTSTSSHTGRQAACSRLVGMQTEYLLHLAQKVCYADSAEDGGRLGVEGEWQRWSINVGIRRWCSEKHAVNTRRMYSAQGGEEALF